MSTHTENPVNLRNFLVDLFSFTNAHFIVSREQRVGFSSPIHRLREGARVFDTVDFRS